MAPPPTYVMRRVACVGLVIAALCLVCTPMFARAEGMYEKDPMSDEEHQRVVISTIDHHSFSLPLLRYYFGAEEEEDVPHWLSSGSTVITDKYVRLTPQETSQTGHFWNTQPLDMHAFEIVVGFHVFREQPGKGADGFAMWIVDSIPRTTGMLFGHPPTFKGIGLLFDVYDNDNGRDNPMISLIYESGANPPRRYSPQRDFRGETLGNCVFDFVNQKPPAKLATVRVRYNEGTMQVYASKNHGKDEVLCFQVNQKVPLDVDKTQYFLGFTAATGGVSEIHDIIYTHLSPLTDVRYTHDVYESKAPAAYAGAHGSIEMNDEAAADDDDDTADDHDASQREAARLAQLEKELAELKKRQETTAAPTPTPTTRAPVRRTRKPKATPSPTTTTAAPEVEEDDDEEGEFEEEDEYDEEEEEETTTTTAAPRRVRARTVKRRKK